MAGVTERGILSLCNNTQAEPRSNRRFSQTCSRSFHKISFTRCFTPATLSFRPSVKRS